MHNLIKQQLGPYSIISLLGQGGFADVYLGMHNQLGRLDAIKVLRIDLRSQVRQAFLTEARICASLKHEHIVRVYDFAIINSLPYLAMDFASQGTLRQRYPRGKRVPLSRLVSYVKQVASALQYIHDHGLIHCDIKPENMLVGEDNKILLSDFGIALVVQESDSPKGQKVVGTIAYMAPEQIQGQPCQASDQYALGVVVYEWLSGHCPFRGTFAEVMSQQLLMAVPPLYKKKRFVSSPMEAVILKALAKEREQRFNTVTDFAEALEQACAPVARINRRLFLFGACAGTIVGVVSTVGLIELVGRFAPPPRGTTLAIYRGLAPEGNVIWTHDGQRIVAADDHTVQFLSVPSLSDPSIYSDHGSLPIALSPDNRLVVSVIPQPPVVNGKFTKGEVFVWEIATGRIRISRSESVTALAWSPDGRYIALGTLEINQSNTPAAVIYVWDFFNGRFISSYTNHTAEISTIAWSSDGQLIASSALADEPAGSSRYAIHIWGALSGQKIYVFSQHASHVNALAWFPLPGLRVIASASGDFTGGVDTTVRVWEATTGKVRRIYRAHARSVNAIAWSPDGKFIASASSDATVQLWDAFSGNHFFTYQGHSERVTGVSWSPDGQSIVSSAESVQVWRAT